MKDKLKIKTEPKAIFAEYEEGKTYKASIGQLGIYEQSKKNERFFTGDQWYGVRCGNDRPLIRYNHIKRVGEYKMSIIGAAPVAVQYTAEGIPNTDDIRKQADALTSDMIGGSAQLSGVPDSVEISAITDAMSAYFRTTSERLKFNIKNEEALRNAFISGMAIGYTYWDDTVNTGLYADSRRMTPIKGDIAFEIIDVENVIFGDPNNEDVQKQPYMLISQRLDAEEVRREAKRNGLPVEDIMPDGANYYNAGDRGESEPSYSRRVTVITKFYKEWDEKGDTYKVMAVKCTEKALVRKPWDIGLTLYPFAVFRWERRKSCAYGDSEITYMIPNQIAVNQMATAECWSALNFGAPKMIVNGDVIQDDITDTPGQVIKVYGSADEVKGAVQYVNPPAWAAQYQNAINDLSSNILSNAGATEAALGQVKPDNAQAIIQMKEAAQQPLQVYQNRFYAYIEDNARIWCDMWLNKYGNRMLHIKTKNGDEYVPFSAERYKNLPFVARVDVGASTLWSESVQISTLDRLLGAQFIDPIQYLSRLPQGIIPKLSELIEDIKQKTEAANQQQDDEAAALQQFAEQYPQEYAQYAQMSPEEQQLMLKQIMGGKQI
jgi:hypothetical protein